MLNLAVLPMINFARFNSLFALATYFDTPAKCKQAIAESRWEDGDVVCPFCGRHHCYTRKDGSYRCPECGKNFSVLVGTIFENTKISLVKWFMAMYLISSHKKGISSVQLAADLAITQKSAWFILHKVRTLFEQDDNLVLSGVVECDEMYLGGRETNKHESKKTPKTQGRSTKTKQPIFGMAMVWKDESVNMETGEVKEHTHTRVRAQKVDDAKATTLVPIIHQFIAEGSTVVTDELAAYTKMGDKYNHVFVHHGTKEYTIGCFSTNGIEGFWGHFKRMVFGTYHFVSKAYLERYINEAVYRFNTREMKESERFTFMFRQAIGRVRYSDVKMAA